MQLPPTRKDTRRKRLKRGLWLVAALLGVLYWVLLRATHNGPAGGDASLPAAGSATQAPPLVVASVPLPKPSHAQAVGPQAAMGSPAQCGVDAAPSPPLPDGLTKAAREAREKRVFEQTLAAMSASANPQANAVALLLTPLLSDNHRQPREPASAQCESKDCPAPAASAAEPPGQTKVDAPHAPSFDDLARMAAHSTDPRIYALAFHACSTDSGGRSAACRLISAEQWARLDADNAVPWGFVAVAAERRGDVAGKREAMHRIAHARRSDSAFGFVPGLLIDHAPAEIAAQDGISAMVVAAIGVEAAWPMPHYQTLSQTCKADAAFDANLAQTCGQIAEVLTEKSNTLIERSIGAAIGKRMGWPPERTEGVRNEFQRLTQAVADAGFGQVELDCAQQRRILDYFRDLGRDGEVTAMRRLATQAPSSLGARGDDRRRAASYPAPTN